MMIFLCGKGTAAEGILQWVLDFKHIRIAVFTHPGTRLAAMAAEHGIWYSTRSVNEIERWPFHPSAITSVGYLDIIKAPVIDRVRGRIFNCHAALLPNHRGRSAVPWAIVDGDNVTGITYHWIDTGIDTGNILLQATCQIDANETQATLFAKIDQLAVDFWPMALRLAMLDLPGAPQRGRSQYHKAGPPHGGVIDPSWPVEYTERFIRAMTYPPLPYATCGGAPVRSMADYEQLRVLA
jgi:methionyl-tRNA formyltransferase